MVHTFPLGICSKVNVVSGLEFEIAKISKSNTLAYRKLPFDSSKFILHLEVRESRLLYVHI